MKIFPPPLAVGPTEGFDPAKDIFNRAGLGEGLANLVATATDPLVIAVNGQWGSGKTTFLKMWGGLLREAKYPVVYFDAFESDYLDDAFLALAGEIISLVKEKKKASSGKGKDFMQKAVNAGKIIAKAGLKIGAKAATLGALGSTEFDDLADDVGEAFSDLVDPYLEELLSNRSAQKTTVEQFRSALSALPSLLKPPLEAETKPLIFILDELDRCRPSFALEILERIKHFFSVPNVHFVLGVNVSQLQNSVKVTYGPNIDGSKYLQKFIDIMFFLYDKADERRERTAKRFVSYLTKAMEFDVNDDVVHGSTAIIGDIAVQLDMSLRDIERVMTTFAIALSFTPKNHFRSAPLIAGLVVLKVIAPEMYLKAKRGTLSFPELKQVINFDALDSAQQYSKERLEEWFRFGLEGEIAEGFEGVVNQISFNFSFGNGKDLVPYIANDVIDRFAPR